MSKIEKLEGDVRDLRFFANTLITFIFKKFPGFRHEYYLGKKELELNYLAINNGTHSSEFKECLEGVKILKKVYESCKKQDEEKAASETEVKELSRKVVEMNEYLSKFFEDCSFDVRTLDKEAKEVMYSLSSIFENWSNDI